MGSHNQDLGRLGENAATRWYLEAGYRVLDRNWRCEHGELDLVVASNDIIVFVEVKARTSTRFGTGFDAVGRAKQQRLRRLAASWLSARRRDGPGSGVTTAGLFADVRFDVVDVDGRGHVRVREGCF